MTEFFDVTIIGGGPAGAAAALTLLKRHPEKSIAIIESTHYKDWRVGETLSPDAGRAFRELGIWESFLTTEYLATEGTCAAWESETVEENEFIYHPEGKGWHLNRVKFDLWMAEQAASKGAHLQKGTRYVSHKRSKEALILTLERSGRYCQVETSLVIDASGRRSSFGRNEKVQRKVYDRLSGSIGFFKAQASPSDISSYTLVEAVETGWWYSAPLSSQHFVVAHMTDADILKENCLHKAQDFRKLLSQSIHTQHRVLGEPMEPLKVLSAASIMNAPVCGDRWLAVGDAASTFDPLSSQGIYKGIRSGMFGAYAASDCLNGRSTALDKYRRFIAEEYGEYLDTRGVFYEKVQRWPQSIFWNRRHSNVAVF